MVINLAIFSNIDKKFNFGQKKINYGQTFKF